LESQISKRCHVSCGYLDGARRLLDWHVRLPSLSGGVVALRYADCHVTVADVIIFANRDSAAKCDKLLDGIVAKTRDEKTPTNAATIIDFRMLRPPVFHGVKIAGGIDLVPPSGFCVPRRANPDLYDRPCNAASLSASSAIARGMAASSGSASASCGYLLHRIGSSRSTLVKLTGSLRHVF
jgi:hypothetical protein